MTEDVSAPATVFVVWADGLGRGEIFDTLDQAREAIRDWAVHASENGPFALATYDRRSPIVRVAASD